MKYLSDIEPLQMHAGRDGKRFVLNGGLPWITNLRREGFVAAAAFDQEGAPPAIFAVPHNASGSSAVTISTRSACAQAIPPRCA